MRKLTLQMPQIHFRTTLAPKNLTQRQDAFSSYPYISLPYRPLACSGCINMHDSVRLHVHKACPHLHDYHHPNNHPHRIHHHSHQNQIIRHRHRPVP